jgi:hypothetical protein
MLKTNDLFLLRLRPYPSLLVSSVWEVAVYEENDEAANEN